MCKHCVFDLPKVISELCLQFWATPKNIYEISLLFYFLSLSHCKQIVDDMIIQTDKNASDIDVENIVNRKVRISVKIN